MPLWWMYHDLNTLTGSLKLYASMRHFRLAFSGNLRKETGAGPATAAPEIAPVRQSASLHPLACFLGRMVSGSQLERRISLLTE